jgi:glycosyltransferase involved in cell wall biosynthesis
MSLAEPYLEDLASITSQHCFVIPAYGESPHLENCLRSLAAQTIKTKVLIATSTPSSHIEILARRFKAPIYVNPRRGGIGSDWNFALNVANSPWVTLAHQDDIYLPEFASRTLMALARRPSAVLAFSGYGEIENDKQRPTSMLVNIKRFLLELGFLGTSHASTRLFKTNAIRFGCAIPCPAVTINTATGLRFRTDLKVDLDWAAWLSLALKPGDFVYIRERLMMHRVHGDSETSAAINTGLRLSEDTMMLRMMWPVFLADMIAASYRIAYRSNRVSTGS